MAKFWKNPFRKREAVVATYRQPAGVIVPGSLFGFGCVEDQLKISAVNRAVTLRATAFATAKCSYERYVKATDSWEEFNKGSEEYRHLNWLLKYRPNKKQNAKQAFEQLRVFGDMYGQAALYIVKVGGRVEQFIPVKVASVDTTGDLYQIENPLFNLFAVNVSQRDLLIIRGLSTAKTPGGLAVFELAKSDAKLSGTIDKLCQEVYDRGGTFRAIIKQESAGAQLSGLSGFDDEQMELTAGNLQDQFNQGAQFAYDPSAGEITPITQSFQDLQLDLQRGKMVESIARHFGVPLPLMMSSTNAVYKSVDDAWLSFEKLTIEPMLQELEEEFNSKLLNEYDMGKVRFRFERHSLCMQSEKEKAETKKIKAETEKIKIENEKGGAV